MTKPPVKLGVGKKFLEKRKEPPSGKMKLVWQPQHFNIGGSMSMNDVKSLSHSKWRCKYHIVFAPKYRRQIIYGRIKADVGKILRDLCKRKNVEIIEAVNDTLRMYKNDDIRMYNFNCITDTIVEVITTCNTYTLLTVHLL